MRAPHERRLNEQCRPGPHEALEVCREEPGPLRVLENRQAVDMLEGPDPWRQWLLEVDHPVDPLARALVDPDRIRITPAPILALAVDPGADDEGSARLRTDEFRLEQGGDRRLHSCSCRRFAAGWRCLRLARPIGQQSRKAPHGQRAGPNGHPSRIRIRAVFMCGEGFFTRAPTGSPRPKRSPPVARSPTRGAERSPGAPRRPGPKAGPTRSADAMRGRLSTSGRRTKREPLP